MTQYSVLELRQYTVLGGKRDVLARLFEREFVATQAAVGAHVLGTYRDLDDPDRFVWLRAFADMGARARALTAFYGGATWRTHRDAANATMIDSDNVHLLRPTPGTQSIPSLALNGDEVLLMTLYYLQGITTKSFGDFFEARLRRELKGLGADLVATLETEPAPNNFPRLPVRENEPVFIWIARFASPHALQDFELRVRQWSGWRDGLAPSVLRTLMRKPERLRLAALSN